MRKLRVAVNGCEQIAQLMHFPYLRELDDQYEVVAAGAVLAQVLQQVGDFSQIPARSVDYGQLLRAIKPVAADREAARSAR